MAREAESLPLRVDRDLEGLQVCLFPSTLHFHFKLAFAVAREAESLPLRVDRDLEGLQVRYFGFLSFLLLAMGREVSRGAESLPLRPDRDLDGPRCCGLLFKCVFLFGRASLRRH